MLPKRRHGRDKVTPVSGLVSARTFFTRHEAELARSLLDSQGIPAWVSSDDYGGLHPALAFAHGVQVLVLSSDLEDALELIEKKGLTSSVPE